MKRLVFVALALMTACRSEDAPPVVAADVSAGARSHVALEDACRGDDADACDVLGAMYLVGKDVAEDRERATELRKKALALFDAACKKGDDKACARIERPCTPMAGGLPPMTDDLPPPATGTDPTISIEIRADGTTALDGTTLSGSALEPRLKTACAARPRAVIRADRLATHGNVILVLDVLKTAGCSKISFGVAAP
jgi:hypothetical protein